MNDHASCNGDHVAEQFELTQPKMHQTDDFTCYHCSVRLSIMTVLISVFFCIFRCFLLQSIFIFVNS